MLYCYWGLYTIWSISTSTGPDPPCWNCSLFATGWKHPLCHSNTVILHIWSMCFPIRGSHQLDRLTQIWVIGLHHAIIAEHPVVVKRSNEWYLVCCGTSRTYSFILCFSRFLWGLESAWPWKQKLSRKCCLATGSRLFWRIYIMHYSAFTCVYKGDRGDFAVQYYVCDY